MADQTPINSTNSSSQVPQNNKIHPVKRFFRKVLLYIFVLFIVIGTAFYMYVNHAIKDDASVEGTLMQFTVGDGFIFKTNEGLINKGNALAVNNWSFSVRNDSLAQVIKGLVGKKVNLHYKENVSNFFWQGKTNRFVFEVEELNN